MRWRRAVKDPHRPAEFEAIVAVARQQSRLLAEVAIQAGLRWGELIEFRRREAAGRGTRRDGTECSRAPIPGDAPRGVEPRSASAGPRWAYPA